MTVLALDTGSTRTGWVLFDEEADRRGLDPIMAHGITENEELFAVVFGTAQLLIGLDGYRHMRVAAEWFELHGMRTPPSLLESVFWLGRFTEALGGSVDRITRREVTTHLLGKGWRKQAASGQYEKRPTTDSLVRAALIARYGPLEADAIGTASAPGPLYGIAGDRWAALGVAVTWADRQREAVASAIDAAASSSSLWAPTPAQDARSGS